MNTNKQLTKGYKMRKMAMVIGILSVLATNANAGYWTQYGNSWHYTPTYNSLMGGWY